MRSRLSQGAGASPAAHSRALWLALGLTLVIVAAAPSRAEEELEQVTGAPEVLSEAVRSVLSPEGWRVSVDGRVLAELWLREQLPEEGINEGALGVEFGAITGSALVGAVRLPELWIDYRDTDLAAGVYTLRYWVQPTDGDHMGVSVYRDFLLLSRAEDDVDPDALYEQEPLLELSKQASGRTHPAVMAVFPVWDDIEGDAALVRNDLDQLTLAVRVGERVLGFVLEGHGDLP